MTSNLVNLTETYGDDIGAVVDDARAAGYPVDEKGRLHRRNFPLELDGYRVVLGADGEASVVVPESNPVWYDLDPNAADLWVIEGPAGLDPATIDTDCLPEGCRWVSDAEWEARPEMRP